MSEAQRMSVELQNMFLGCDEGIPGRARQNGCLWGNRSCAEAAAGGGHLHLLQWARQKGRPYDKLRCLKAAKQGGQTHVAAWVENN